MKGKMKHWVILEKVSRIVEIMARYAGNLRTIPLFAFLTRINISEPEKENTHIVGEKRLTLKN
jgi:hypothetical protein